MPSTTATRTETSRTLSLPLTGAATPRGPNDLLVKPVQRTAALAAAEREQLTPAIGVRFTKDLQLKKIINLTDKKQQKDLLQDLAYEISLQGVAFFPAQDLDAADIATLALLLGEACGKPADSTLHIHPTQELGENGLPVGQITNVVEKDGRQISFMDERSKLASTNWHTDISFEPRPANYSLLRMHTLPTTGGDTLFSSAYAHYEMLSSAMQAFLSTLTATHHAEMFREQSQRHGFKLRTDPRGSPHNSGDSFRTSHPVIRTNPTTGLQGLFVNQCFTSKIDQLTWDESDALLKYLFTLQAQSHDAQVRYRWQEGDLAIWDNRATLHAATFDYGAIPRIGDRAVCCGEEPYFDPNGLSRSAFLSQQLRA